MSGERTTLNVDGREIEVIPRSEAERIAASQDRAALARMAYAAAFPNPAADIDGQAVLDLTTGEVRPSSLVEGSAGDPDFAHLLPLMACEAELKARLSEEEFVRATVTGPGRRPGPAEIAEVLDGVYGRA